MKRHERDNSFSIKTHIIRISAVPFPCRNQPVCMTLLLIDVTVAKQSTNNTQPAPKAVAIPTRSRANQFLS